ncbi:MAG: EAL domain-containing protein [Micavibrio sp.]
MNVVNPQIPSPQSLGLAQQTDDHSYGNELDQTGIRSITCLADHVLFKAGEPRNAAYLIDSGEVHLLAPDGEVLCKLGPGEIFGEMALVDGGVRTVTAVTAMLSDIFVIPRTALQDRIHNLDPILSLMIGLLIERYRAARPQMPESIRQDQVNELTATLEKTNKLPDDLAGLSNIRVQKESALKELKLEQELRQGLERNELFPVFQPILNLANRRIIGFETLIRWNHPEKGLVYPDKFIPVAERTGVVQLLDKMMLARACDLIPSLLKTTQGKAPDFFVSVNLSGINFATLDVIHSVREALVQSEVEPQHLKLEITESALIADPQKAEQVLHGLRALGVTIALDDFGTGYSSLGYLHRFPIDSIKIDRSFVSQIQKAPKSLDIVRAIVGLARNFNLGVIAEGIETEQDMAMISSLGCEMGQGYLFGKPMSIDDAHDFIRANLINQKA